MINFILFAGSELLIFIALTLLKKTEHSMSFVQWAGVGWILVMCWNAFLAGVLNLIHFPNGLDAISLITILTAVLILFKIRGKEKQSYQTDRTDWWFLIIMTGVCALFLAFYFRRSLNLRFISVDAAVHTRFAKEFALHHRLKNNLFFSAVNDGLVMEAVLPFAGKQNIVHVFPLMRVVDLFITGMIFYSVIAGNTDRSKKIGMIVITGLYVMGYPLNTELFGFAYYGASNFIIAAILILTRFYDENRQCAVIGLNLCLFGLFTSYTLLVPVIYLFVFLTMLRKKASFKKMIQVFLIPTVIGMLYAYVNLKEITPSGGITNEGGKYFDLYADFILILPFMIADVIYTFRNRKVQESMILEICTFLYWLLFLCLTINNKVSVYYFSKIYNLCWFCAFVSFTDEYMKLMEKDRSFMISFLVVDLCLILTSVLNITHEAEPESNNGLLSNAAGSVTSVYSFNYSYLKNEPYFPEETEDLFNHAEKFGNHEILYCGNEVMSQWYMTFTEKTDVYTGSSADQLKNRIRKKNYKYLCILYDESGLFPNAEALKGQNAVYSGKTGEIVRIEVSPVTKQ